MTDDRTLTERDVRSEDPSLSDGANRELTAELRDIVGTDTVEVPEGRPMHNRDRHAKHSTLGATLIDNRDGIVITGGILLVIAVLVAAATKYWWIAMAAVALDAVIAVGVVLMTMQFTSDIEHPSPALAARLQEEGVADPDAMLTDLAEDFAESGDAATNRRTVRPDEDAEKATVEQRASITPSSERSRPAGPGDAN